MGLYVGFALMALGIVMICIGRSKSKSVQVEARNGSVAVGGNNSGSIKNVNVGTRAPEGHEVHYLTYLAIGVELIGIVVTLWHAWHMLVK